MEKYNINSNFEEKRINGENDSYLCSLIRNDSVENFVCYEHQTNISLTMQRSIIQVLNQIHFFKRKNHH